MKKKGIVCVGVILIFIVGLFVLFSMSKNDLLAYEEPEKVSPKQANEMYASLTKNCEGALIWGLKVGDKIEIKNLSDTSACKNDNYFSKMVAYSYNSIGVTLYVNVLKKEQDNLYKLDGTIVSKYHESTLKESLDKGTTYIYTFQKEKEKYKLVQVELMESVSFNQEGAK